MPIIIAITNQKGGVGKTTTAINLGASLAIHHHKKVLAIDLDQQGNLSDGLGIEIEPEQTILEALLRISDHKVYPYRDHFHVIPANKDFSSFEANINHPDFEDLKHEVGQEYLLKEYLANHCQDYDFVLLDCPPNLNLITINGLVAANKVLIPLKAHGFSTKGLQTVLNLMTRLAKRLNKELELAGAFFVEHDERTILSRDLADEVRLAVSGKICQTYIRKNVALAESSQQHMDIFSYDEQMEQESNGAVDYRNLTNELLGKKVDEPIYQPKNSEEVSKEEREAASKTELAAGFQAFLKAKKDQSK